MDNKRPDSLCSNSNDSGLSDVNCNFSAEAQAAAAVAGLDASGGFRPKIWSLAHVATSDNSPSPYLTSVSAARRVPLPVPGRHPRWLRGAKAAWRAAGGKQPLSSSSIPSGMQPWGGASSLYGGAPSPRSSSFGMSMGMGMGMNVNMNMNNHHHKGSLAPPMFSHPLTGMASGLGPSSGGYTQLSPFYPQSKLSVD
nr:hypothetical protein BaRGS_014500 [Batillaria attramentaria]